MNTIKYLGVDGCKGGWFAVGFTEDCQYDTDVFSNIQELVKRYPYASLILIDIPIGLKETGEGRACDILARKLLGERAPVVFPAPCRQVMKAKDYNGANELSRKSINKGLPIQAWGICPKIKEVDGFIRKSKKYQSILMEAHPEVCFCKLSGYPMPFSKKKASGQRQRLEVLNSIHKKSSAIFNKSYARHRGKEIAKDDVLDALVMAIMAYGGPDGLESIPDPPGIDSKGLPMRMVYKTKKNLSIE